MKELLKNLIKARSIPQNGELAAAKTIADYLAKAKISSKIDSWENSRANIIARIESSNQKPALMFVCHLDVVEPGDEQWDFPPFCGEESDGKILGRGATDMLGGTSAILAAITDTVKENIDLKGNIIFAATAGEEVDSCGVKKFLEKYSNDLPNLAGIVIPEPTGFQIVTEHRGIFWLKITTKGKTAHGSTPQAGVNAITSMTRLIEKLEEFNNKKLPAASSMSINTINAGKAINVIPDSCSIGIDIRLIPGQDHQQLLESFEKIFADLKELDPDFKAQIEIIRHVASMKTDSNSPFVKKFLSTVDINETISVGFTTDGAHLKELKAPIVIFGPGQSGLCHKPNEYIDLSDVEKARQYYKKIISEFLT